MSFFTLFAITLLVLSVYCVLDTVSVTKLLPCIQPAHAVPLSRREELGTFRRRIVAVGDLHGDLEHALKILQFSHVINENQEWSGKVDFLVQTGDMIDRGDFTNDLFYYMDVLREQASKKGGAVISLMGNHEWMNAIGDWRYVAGGDIMEFANFEVAVDEDEWKAAIGDEDEWVAAISDKDDLKAAIGDWHITDPTFRTGVGKRMVMIYKATGAIGKSWAENYRSAARLPLHSFLGQPNTPYNKDSPPKHQLSHAALSFVHGGLALSYPHLNPFPTVINEISKSLLRKVQGREHLPRPFEDYKWSSSLRVTNQERRLHSGDGPLWYRGWAEGEDEEQLCKEADIVLERTGTRRMIMGHTVNTKTFKITERCGGKIILIDTGISRIWDGGDPKEWKGKLSALSIEYTLTPSTTTAETPEEQEWEEHEVVTALYADSKEPLTPFTRTIKGDFRTRSE